MHSKVQAASKTRCTAEPGWCRAGCTETCSERCGAGQLVRCMAAPGSLSHGSGDRLSITHPGGSCAYNKQGRQRPQHTRIMQLRFATHQSRSIEDTIHTLGRYKGKNCTACIMCMETYIHANPFTAAECLQHRMQNTSAMLPPCHCPLIELGTQQFT
jgi:hypothetical protein